MPNLLPFLDISMTWKVVTQRRHYTFAFCCVSTGVTMTEECLYRHDYKWGENSRYRKKNGGIKNINSYEISGFQFLTINTGNKMKPESILSVFCMYKKPLWSLAYYLCFIEEETKPLGVRTLFQHLMILPHWQS